MQLQIQLAHAEAGRRVVQATAWEGNRCLGSALGEGATAEEAEDRAVERLQRRLAVAGSAAAVDDGSPVTPSPPVTPRPPSPRGPEATTPAVQRTPPARPPAPPDPPPEPPTPIPTPVAMAPEPSASAALEPPAAPEPPADPEDWSDELAQLELELQRLGWGREQEAAYLERVFGHPSRSRLTRYADLTAYLAALRRAPGGADPAGVPAPVRRVDLLEQSDALLRQLQWDAARGRSFLERHFAFSSRQQLSDEQLLRFNLLLEEEAVAGAGAGAGGPSAPAAVGPQQ